jgi:hypothetical protein
VPIVVSNVAKPQENLKQKPKVKAKANQPNGDSKDSKSHTESKQEKKQSSQNTKHKPHYLRSTASSNQKMHRYNNTKGKDG